MTNALNAYQRQAVMNASAEELISIIYDGTIAATYRKDERKLLEGLKLLIDTLNFEYEIANNYYNLYEHCRIKAREQDFATVRELLSDIRDAWNTHVLKKEAVG